MGAGHAHALYVHEHTPLHRLAPEAKLVAALGFVLAVAVTPRHALWALGIDAAVLMAVARWGRLPGRFVVARMAAVLPFVLFAVLIPFIAHGEEVVVIGVAVSREGLWGAWNIVSKALLGVTVSIVLAGTTEIPDLLRGMERLRVPWVFTAVAGFMVRYLELIAGELGRMRVAMQARAYQPRWLWQAKPVAAAAGALFVRTYERGERIHAAMLARGYEGSMPRLRDRRARRGEWLAVGAFVAVPASVAAAAILAA